MAETTNFSNFNFLKSVNRDLFETISHAERLARTDFIDCGQKSRKACEIFIDSVLIKKGLSRQITGNLFDKISALRDESLLRSAGYLGADQRLSDHLILPELGMVTFVTTGSPDRFNGGARFNGGPDRLNGGANNYNRAANNNRANHPNRTTCDYYDFLRRFGNACSHPRQNSYDPKICFDNVVKCLQGYYLLFSRYYAGKIPRNIGPFQKDRMPIDSFYITRAYTPSDQNRSKCGKEYFGYSLDARGNISYYAILRQYDKEDVDHNFMLRNSDVFLQASRETIYGIPEGMTSIRTVVGLNNRASSFYITAHLFRFEPKPLSRQLLQHASLRQRLELCAGIANCFYNLHNADNPIYHRLLTYDSIVVCNFKNRLIPYVVKFDYGKLSMPALYTTIFNQAKQAELNLQGDKSLTKYLAPEWPRITSTDHVDWEKIDIFSLGVLFSDILAGRFDGSLVSYDELLNLGLSEDLADVIDTMTSPRISDRSGLDYVRLVLQEELKNLY